MLSEDVTRKKLQGFIDQVCAGQSPLYEHVCPQILNDEPIFEQLRYTPAQQPGPNLFLAAVHYLLLRGATHELRQFYGTCVEQPRPPEQAWPAFRDFCLAQRTEILELMSRGRVQTNEVGRCSYLFPALSMVHARQPDRPLAIIEIGASAGLNLNWDRYAYDYGPAGKFDPSTSAVIVCSEWRGAGPALPAEFPPVASRLGIDLHPVNVNDVDQATWLQALVWPDQPQRQMLLRKAIEEFRHHPATLVAGDALQVLPAEISNVPLNATLCLVHTHTFNQLSEEQRADVDRLISDASVDRHITVISAEWIRTPQTELRLESWRNGSRTDSLLAEVDHHGRWINWRR